LNEIQSYLEIAALYQLIQMLRNGTYPGDNHTFKKIVHIGHFFGRVGRAHWDIISTPTPWKLKDAYAVRG